MNKKGILFTLNGYLISLILLCANVCMAADAGMEINPETLYISEVKAIVHAAIGQQKVLTTARARQGQMFSKQVSEEDCQRIAKIDGVRKSYYSIEVQNNQVVLTYVAITDRFVGDISFVGNKKVNSKKLLKEIGVKTNDYLDLAKVRAGVKDLTDYYLNKGYPFVKVTLDESTIDTNTVIDLEYNIEEGPRCKIRKVNFEGNAGLTDKMLSKVPESRIRKFLVLPVYYVAEKLPTDAASLQQAYEKFGYLNVNITHKVQFSSDRKTADVTFTVTEGPVFYVDSISVEGSDYFAADELSENFRLVVDQAYGQQRVDYDLRNILSKFKENGFIDATVDLERELSEDNKVMVKYKIDSGDRFRIGRIYITGNNGIHDKFIRGILDEEGFTPGNWYDAYKASGDGEGELERRVRDMALAKTVTIEPVPEETSGESMDSEPITLETSPADSGEFASPITEQYRNVQVNMLESKTGSLMFGAGVNSNLGLVGNITLDQRNFDIGDTPESWKEFITGQAFKGAGQRFRVSISPGNRQSSYMVSFGDSYVYDKPVAFETALSSFQRYQETYYEQRTKFFIGFEKRYQNKWRRGISFRVEQVDVDSIETTAPREIKDNSGANNLFGVRFGISKDTTDDIHMPSRGYNFDMGYEQVAGEHTFGVMDVTHRWYKTLYEDLGGRKTVLETKLVAATTVGEAPFFEKYYAGGTGSIRGFEYRGVSTRGKPTNTTSTKEEDPIGSNWLLTASGEVVVPLEAEALSWLFFMDSGLIDQGGVRASVGTGIQIMLPQWFGPVPMRFELAAPILKDSRDETRIFSFSAGALF